MMIICHYHVYRYLQYCRLFNALCLRIRYTTIAEIIIYIKISQQSGSELLFVMMIHVRTCFDHHNRCDLSYSPHYIDFVTHLYSCIQTPKNIKHKKNPSLLLGKTTRL